MFSYRHGAPTGARTNWTLEAINMALPPERKPVRLSKLFTGPNLWGLDQLNKVQRKAAHSDLNGGRITSVSRRYWGESVFCALFFVLGQLSVSRVKVTTND